MGRIEQQLRQIQDNIAGKAKLVAVSKFHPSSRIEEAYNAGQRIFGENRVQELAKKVEQLSHLSDIEWHLIGTLQRNKVKYIVPYIHTIHSIDTPSLLKEIESQSNRQGREAPPIRLLLQVHISKEESKHGFYPNELLDFLDKFDLKALKYSRIVGLMGMAEFTDDESIIEDQFASIQELYTKIKNKYFATQSDFKELSIGMSNDYDIALKYGATYVRIGTDIFGEREY